MKQSEIKKALCNIEIDKIIIGSHMEQLPEHIIDLILYFIYIHKFKNRDELRTAVRGYPGNIKKYGNISGWDVSNVTDMSWLFNDSQLSWLCNDSQFKGDISKWDVSDVTDMKRMFNWSQFTADISKWNVSNVTDMSMMFHNSAFTGDISKWTMKP